MVRRPAPLPEGLTPLFTVGQGIEQGMSHGRLQRGDLVAPTSGVRTARGGEPALDALLARCQAFALALPEPWAYSHTTAARLLGLPLATPWTDREPLPVIRPTNLAMVRRRGTVHHRGLERRRVVTRQGLPVIAPADTWCDLAGSLSLTERVVLADATVNTWSGVPLDQLITAVARRDGERGVRALREALALVRTRSRSRTESLIRLALAAAGLPEPELNADIHDAQGGWVACSDFVWRRQRVLAEYDGDHHREQRQWRRDHIVRADLIAEGWRVHVFTATDLGRPAALHRRVAALATDLGVVPTSA